MAEIAADFDDMPSLTERPIIAVLVRVLYFLKGMVEGIFAKALKAISGSVENRCSEAERVARWQNAVCPTFIAAFLIPAGALRCDRT